jgi:DNA-binding response OmpR family regulator
MFQILVVEDDTSTRRLMQALLENNGYKPIAVADGIVALEKLDNTHIDAIILDVMMPRMDGYQFVRELREGGSLMPILMVTARSTQDDKLQGLRLGVDDYMTKPVDEEEMLLRLAALLRRAKIAQERKIVIGNTVLDYDAQSVISGGQVWELPNKEFMLLFKLLSYPNKIFTRRQVMDEIWDMDSESDERTVDVHINRLREHFGSNRDFQIITIRGLGYKAVKEGDK